MSFARGIRSPATAAPLLRQGDEQQGRGDGVALQQWRGSGLFDVSNHFEYGLLLNGVLAALLFFSGKYKSSLTKAGLFNAFLLGFNNPLLNLHSTPPPCLSAVPGLSAP